MRITELEPDAVLKISGAIDIGGADELCAALAAYAMREPPLTLDLSGVDGCDTAALQLFCSLRKTALDANKALRIGALSTAIVEASAAVGLSLEEFAPDAFHSTGGARNAV